MKNYLKYFYDIDNVNIYQNKSDCFFSIQNYNYKFFKYIGDINKLNDIYMFSSNLLKNGIYCHQIIKNKDQNIVSYINGKNYILLRYYKNLDKKINIIDILNFNFLQLKDQKFDCSDWKTLWELKIDYFGYQLNQFGYKHPLLRESFGYYSGYVELAISLLTDLQINSNNLLLSHKRLSKDSTLYDLYDPFNLILDNKVRDIAEYFKSKIFDKDIIQKIINYFNMYQLQEYDYNLFFIRMLYPSFYFDRFEKIMNNNLNDDDIEDILKNTPIYEQFIKKLYKYVSSITNIPTIEWLMY